MVGMGLKVGKAAAMMARKLATARAGRRAARKALKKSVELLGTGEVVRKIAEVATSAKETQEAEGEGLDDLIQAELETEMGEMSSEVETSETSGPSELEVASTPVTLTRRLPDGDNDEGKGWQCSKYAWYLATGVRMNYTPNPDYGPCHGAGMVDYLITNLGWKECGKKNGAIFAYNDDQFGHTGVVVDAEQNLVNDANTLNRPLMVDTHVEDLDGKGARYAEG